MGRMLVVPNQALWHCFSLERLSRWQTIWIPTFSYVFLMELYHFWPSNCRKSCNEALRLRRTWQSDRNVLTQTHFCPEKLHGSMKEVFSSTEVQKYFNLNEISTLDVRHGSNPGAHNDLPMTSIPKIISEWENGTVPCMKPLRVWGYQFFEFWVSSRGVKSDTVLKWPL